MRMSGFLFAFLRSYGLGKKRFYTFYNFYNAIYQHIKPKKELLQASTNFYKTRLLPDSSTNRLQCRRFFVFLFYLPDKHVIDYQ